MPSRDSIFLISLVLVALACFPILGLLFANATPESVVIARATETPIPSPTIIPSPTPMPRVYLLPLTRIFAIGQTQPVTGTISMLYEYGTDVFQLVEKQNAFAKLQTLDGKMSFWTSQANVSLTSPATAQYDFSGRGKTVRLIPATSYICLHEEAPPPSFSTCQSAPNFSTAKLAAKIASGAVTMYLVEIEGKNYYAPPEIVLAIQ